MGSQGREIYQELSHVLEGTNPDKADIVGALTKTFKGIALTVEENEEVSKSTPKLLHYSCHSHPGN